MHASFSICTPAILLYTLPPSVHSPFTFILEPSHVPDRVPLLLIQIGANAGVIGMTKEHLGLALALNVPVFVVVTKVDMCPPNVLQETLKLLTRILKSPGCRKIPVIVQNKDDVICSATNFTSER